MKSLTWIIILSTSFWGCGGDLRQGVPTSGETEINPIDSRCSLGTMDVNGVCVPQGSGCPVSAILLDDLNLVEYYAPLAVSDCIPGGDIGREVSYFEKQQVEVRSRHLNLNLPSCPQQERLEINFSTVFGLDVSAQVSTQSAPSLDIQGYILPERYGQFFRQTVEVQRIAVLLNAHDEIVGKALLTDWMFTSELAIGSTCPQNSSLEPSERHCIDDCGASEDLQ